VTIKTKVFAKSHYLTQFCSPVNLPYLNWRMFRYLKNKTKIQIFFCCVEKRERDHQ